MTGSPSIALVHNKDNFHQVISYSIPISRAHPTSSPKLLASVIEMNASITPDAGTTYLVMNVKFHAGLKALRMSIGLWVLGMPWFHPVGLRRSILLNSLKPNSIVAASTVSDCTERFAKRRTDSAEEAALCFKKVKCASSGPSACDICKKILDPLINLRTSKPSMKKALMESDQANASFLFIHQEKGISKTKSYAMELPALDQKQGGNKIVCEAEVKVGGGLESSIEDAHGEEAGDEDSIDGEESLMEYADSEEAGDEDDLDGKESSIEDVDGEEAGNEDDIGEESSIEYADSEDSGHVYDYFNDYGDKVEAEGDVREGNPSDSDSPGAESIFGGSITPVNRISPGSDVQRVMWILRFCLQY